MNKRLATILLALVLPLAVSTTGWAQARVRAAQQDTTQAGQVGPRRGMRGAWMRGGGPGFGRAGFAAEHAGPRRLIGLRDELGLSEDQVSQLEKIHEGHQSLMQAQMQQLRTLQDSLRQARIRNDYAALEKGIDERATLEVGIAKGRLNVERQALEVLNDEQRSKFETWQEGVRVFRRQGIERRRGMRGQGMRGRGMRRQNRLPPPNQPS